MQDKIKPKQRVKCNTFPDHEGEVIQVDPEFTDPRLEGRNVIILWDDGICSVENSTWLTVIGD